MRIAEQGLDVGHRDHLAVDEGGRLVGGGRDVGGHLRDVVLSLGGGRARLRLGVGTDGAM